MASTVPTSDTYEFPFMGVFYNTPTATRADLIDHVMDCVNQIRTIRFKLEKFSASLWES